MKLFKSRFSIITFAFIAVVLVAAILTVVLFSGNSERKDIVVAKCNGVNITKSVFQMYLFTCASQYKNEKVPYLPDSEYNALTNEEKDEYNKLRDTFWDTEIDGRMPVDIVKEKTLDAVKFYAYFKLQCELNNISMTKEEIQGFNSSMETYFDLKKIDTVKDFGVEKDWFISYHQELEVFDIYLRSEASKLNIGDGDIMKYFNENREDYATVTVNTIFLECGEDDENRNSQKELAFDIKKKLQEGVPFKTLSDSYSEYKGNDNGTFIIYNDSSLLSVFGDKYIKSVLKSSVNEIDVIETPKGFYINQTVKVDMTDTVRTKIITIIQDERYMNQVESIIKNNSSYVTEIVNQAEFDSIGIPDVLK